MPRKFVLKVSRHCLQIIEDGHDEQAPDCSVKGTKVYLSLVAKYVDIFFSTSHTLTQRIENAAFFSHFISIWRNFIIRQRQFNLAHNFITRECYQDCLLSVQFAVMLIVYYRDNYPTESCPLD